jgi:hypothetical protein
MKAVRFFSCALVALCLTNPARAVTPVYKCIVKGTVTFQRDPCPSNLPRNDPTPERLNTERRQRVEQSGPPASAAAPRSVAPAPPAPTPEPFRCDGRTYCAQMHSCAEAKYFLAHCPGVNMDGNRDGVPCERQWCSR